MKKNAFAGWCEVLDIKTLYKLYEISSLNTAPWGAWMVQSVKHLTSAQVMISWFVGSSPVSGSVLTGQSLEPALDSVSLSLFLSLCLSTAYTLSLSFSKINRHLKKFKYCSFTYSEMKTEYKHLKSISISPCSCWTRACCKHCFTLDFKFWGLCLFACSIYILSFLCSVKVSKMFTS